MKRLDDAICYLRETLSQLQKATRQDLFELVSDEGARKLWNLCAHGSLLVLADELEVHTHTRHLISVDFYFCCTQKGLRAELAAANLFSSVRFFFILKDLKKFIASLYRRMSRHNSTESGACCLKVSKLALQPHHSNEAHRYESDRKQRWEEMRLYPGVSSHMWWIESANPLPATVEGVRCSTLSEHFFSARKCASLSTDLGSLCQRGVTND